jgi:hypothetical protein
MTSDELFKQMNYRANMRAQILRQARSEGITDPAMLAQRLMEQKQFAFGPGGQAAHVLPLQYARDATFTTEMAEGSWGKSFQNLAADHPMFRVVMPFIRTPFNVFNYSWKRTPILNRFNAEVKLDLAAGGERAALAQSRVEMGYAIWGTGALLASAGLITGRGPGDPDLKRQMMDTQGWQPYSIRIGDRWVSYKKGDPVFTALGLVADLVTISGEMAEKDQQMYFSAAIAAITSNLTNRFFMQGAAEFMDAISSGDEKAINKFGVNLASSFLPNAARQLNGDDTLREARSFVDELLERTPGFQVGETKIGSARLEPRRNLFGEKVMLPPGVLNWANRAFNPFTVSGPVKDWDVADELIKLGRGIPMPSTTMFKGMIDLTDREKYGIGDGNQSPYDRMLEVIGNPPPESGLKPLRQFMEELVQSEEFKKLPTEDADGKGGTKLDMARFYVASYQQFALEYVIQNESENLRLAYEQALKITASGKLQGMDGMRNAMEEYERLFVKPKGQR